MQGRRVLRTVVSCVPFGRTRRGNADRWYWTYDCGHQDVKDREAAGRVVSFLLSRGLGARGKCYTCSAEAERLNPSPARTRW